MKRTVIGLLALCVILVAAGCKSGPAIPLITIEDDHFSITPQEFIDGWNAAVGEAQKATKDEAIAALLTMPDFVASGDKIKMGDVLTITLETSADKLSKIKLDCDGRAPRDEQTAFVFMVGMLPSYLNAKSTLDLPKEIAENYGKNIYDGRIRYVYVAGDFGVQTLSIGIAKE